MSETEVHTSPITGDGGGGSSRELDKEMMAQGGDVCVLDSRVVKKLTPS